MEVNEDWVEDFTGDDEDYSFKEYEVTSSPNDFNIKTLFDFIESGVVKIPAFQRNFVWDIKRSSKLIESLIIGLPIPQIFLYEESRNSFLVIDGQQRLMSIYYFIKKRFPKKDKRIELRRIFDMEGKIPDDVLFNSDYFADFNLALPEQLPDFPNKLKKLNYSTLGDNKASFELRTIRNVIIKQNLPEGDNSAMFEIFNRLNTGGVNLKPQEIRASMYHSDFYEMLYRINTNGDWRKIINRPEPDLHMGDIEILLRGFAMLLESDNYKPSMTRFLNTFSNNAKKMKEELISYLEELFLAFSFNASKLGEDAFTSKNNKINISIFESVFCAMCKRPFSNRNFLIKETTRDRILELKNNSEFIQAIQKDTASKKNVEKRLELANNILFN
ncbi:DUF262 domain-containing protein [Imperialibacter roseus]|uniref:DUF262 domain-containing protein n=1 Tax=Imperialibacter roseus TaxID=1324217 RepID=A0ABZ0IVZ2_9BACT|nr:DUF262 domain-containing protein [Imperialibacter roseus]WOK08786.1 DUF262 domain-containing protein [Imperialibacter roseus]